MAPYRPHNDAPIDEPPMRGDLLALLLVACIALVILAGYGALELVHAAIGWWG